MMEMDDDIKAAVTVEGHLLNLRGTFSNNMESDKYSAYSLFVGVIYRMANGIGEPDVNGLGADDLERILDFIKNNPDRVAW